MEEKKMSKTKMTSDLIVYWETSSFIRRRPLLLGSLEFVKNKSKTMKTICQYLVIFITNVTLLGIAVLFLYIGIRDNCWSGTLDPCFYLPTWMILVSILIFVDRLIYWKHKFNGVIFEGKFPRPRSSIRHSNKVQIRQWQKDKSQRSSSKKLMNCKIILRIIIFFVTLGLTVTSLLVMINAVHSQGAEKPDPIVYSFYFGILALFVYLCIFFKFSHNLCMERLKKSKNKTPVTPMPEP